MKWIDLGIGLLGLMYLIPPHRPRDIGSAMIALGFLVSFVLYNKKF